MIPDKLLICHLSRKKTFIIIPSEPHPGTRKILENCWTTKTQEQAFQYSTFRMQWHNKCHPIKILLC